MQDIHYHLEKPYIDQSLSIKVGNQSTRAKITKINSSSPQFIDSVFIRQEGASEDSLLSIIKGQWQVELLASPHKVVFLKSITSSPPRTRIPLITKEEPITFPAILRITLNGVKDDIRYNYTIHESGYRLKIDPRDLSRTKEKYHFSFRGSIGADILVIDILRDNQGILRIDSSIFAAWFKPVTLEVNLNNQGFRPIKQRG